MLSTRDLNRALLARQLLLERRKLSVVVALERVAGLQTQYAPSGYVGLWSRLAGFRRSQLTRALERRKVVHATLMRATIHMVSARDYLLFSAGVRRARREWWVRAARTRPQVDYERVAATVANALRDGPVRRAALVSVLEDAGYDRSVFEGAQLWVDMVRVPPSGTWERRRADFYALADMWLGQNPFTEDEGVQHLVRRYLGGFGPAPQSDIANWAGLPVGVISEVAPRIATRTLAGADGSMLYDLRGAPLPDAMTPAPVRFLPTWDANLLVHARRAGVLTEEHRPRIFSTKNPQSVGTVLVDGAVAATWRLTGHEVDVEFLGSLDALSRAEVASEAGRLTRFHTGDGS